MRKITLAISLIALATSMMNAARAAEQDVHAGHAEHQHGEHTHGSSAIGKPGDPNKASRTVNVSMSDNMRFSPQSISVKRGEVIKFNVTNAGKVKHEMVIGSVSELQEHAKMMQKFPEMEHAEPNQVTVDPGKSGVIVWQFDTAGKVDFACLQPGHFEAGMKGEVMVKNK